MDVTNITNITRNIYGEEMQNLTQYELKTFSPHLSK